jgi:hypothetical protein
MKPETQTALDLLVEELKTRDPRVVLEQILSLGGEDIEQAIVLLGNLTQA